MNTKEAIEFLEYDHKYKINRNSAYNIKKHNEEIQKIIALLKRGEKFMEYCEYAGIREFEQEYFPKEVIK